MDDSYLRHKIKQSKTYYTARPNVVGDRSTLMDTVASSDNTSYDRSTSSSEDRDARLLAAHVRRNPTASGNRSNGRQNLNSAKRTMMGAYKDTDN